MLYQIHFEAELPADALRRHLHQDYGIAPESVYVGRIKDRSVDDPRPVAMFTPPDQDEEFGWILTGDSELAEATGQNERDLAVSSSWCHRRSGRAARTSRVSGTGHLLATSTGAGLAPGVWCPRGHRSATRWNCASPHYTSRRITWSGRSVIMVTVRPSASVNSTS